MPRRSPAPRCFPPNASGGSRPGAVPTPRSARDASINIAAVAELAAAFPDLDVVFIESGGDNLAATFSPELADLTIYVIDTAAGQDIPRKRGPGLSRSDILVVNKDRPRPPCRCRSRSARSRHEGRPGRTALCAGESPVGAGRTAGGGISRRRRRPMTPPPRPGGLAGRAGGGLRE